MNALVVAQAKLAEHLAAYKAAVAGGDAQAAAAHWTAVRGLRAVVEQLWDERERERERGPAGMMRCNGPHASEMYVMPGEACPLCAALDASKEG